MDAFAKKKDKEGTRGAKKIAKENMETVAFYHNMILGANGFYFTGRTLLGACYHDTEIVCILLCAIIYIAGYQFMARLGSPTYSSSDAKSAALLDPGLDLNMENGMAEYVKDAICLTSAVQILAIYSNYCWLGLLFVPLRGGQMLWSNVISPWIFAPPTEENIDEKKQK